MSERIDPKLRAHFKEIARSIISDDRFARKHGLSQNTIGKITSAIVRAYLMGRKGEDYASLKNTTQKTDVVDWITIPPRARDTLWSMSIWLSSRFGKPYEKLSDIERLSDAPKLRWRIVRDRIADTESTISDGGVSPLIRMGLLEAVDAREVVFRLTQLGVATCQEYWRRFDAGDPTLPKTSLR